jgi:hypothetical protein
MTPEKDILPEISVVTIHTAAHLIDGLQRPEESHDYNRALRDAAGAIREWARELIKGIDYTKEQADATTEEELFLANQEIKRLSK